MPPTSAHQRTNVPAGLSAEATVRPTSSIGTQQDSTEQIAQRRRAGDEQSPRATSAQLPVSGPRLEANHKSPKSLTVANAFPGGVGRFPNNPVIFAGLLAIFKGGTRAQFLIDGWQQSESGSLLYIHLGNCGGRILLYPSLVRKPEQTLTSTDTQWEFVGRLTPFTADVALAVLAQLCEPSLGDRPKYPMLEPVLITATAILGYKGITRRGIERRILVQRIQDEMELLRGLHFDIERFPAFDAVTGKWTATSCKGDRLFDIVRVEVTQEALSDKRPHPEVAWQVRAGQWAYWWLNTQGRVYLGRMARSLLELDHRSNRGPEVMAKKLGARLLFLFYSVSRRQRVLRLRIENLLMDIGELPRSEARDAHWASRCREHFEQAMNMLGQGGINLSERVEWQQGYGPDDIDRCKGWPEKWLGASVSITIPDSAPHARDPSRTPGKSPRVPKNTRNSKDEGWGRKIRNGRLNRGKYWRQQDLARRLHISPTYLSLIETGKRQPSKRLQISLRQWLEPLQT